MKTNSIASKIAGIAFAAALVAGSAVALPASGGDDNLAGLSRQDALRLSQPVHDRGDDAYNIPVLSGNTYRG